MEPTMELVADNGTDCGADRLLRGQLWSGEGQIAYRTLNKTLRFIQVMGQAGDLEALKWFNSEMRFKRSDTLSMANWEFLSSWAQINLSCQVGLFNYNRMATCSQEVQSSHVVIFKFKMKLRGNAQGIGRQNGQ
ncbi:hypothetical protein V8E54_009695 [Elaphomyces granulatus]